MFGRIEEILKLSNPVLSLLSSCQSVELFHLEFLKLCTSPPSFGSDLEKASWISFLSANGAGVFDDLQNLWIHLNIQVLLFRKPLMAVIDLWSDKESKSVSNDGVANVYDPLVEEINIELADEINDKEVNETYLTR